MIKYSDFLEKIQKKETTCVDFTREILDKIEKNKHLNVFITVCGEKALAQAAESDKRFSEGNPRKLEGMIVAVKDNISTKGIRTTCASRMLENFEPIYDATAVERLMAEGAIIIGKTNLDEFAMGSSNETSYFGNVLNPINNEYTPGGSSGGSAAAVAAGLCHVALGSDTGGSVRQPAAFCGTIGLKPTYGRISRWGLVAFASSLDQIGILSADAADTARMLDVISGADAKDSTCANMPPSQTFDRLSNSPEKFTFGVISNELLNNCSTDIIDAYNFYVEKLKSLGGEPRVISLTNPKIWIPTYNILATAEASSNLSRYDGVRYGFRAEGEDDFVTRTRSEGFGMEVKRRIMLGTFVLSSGYYDAYYTKAQKARRLIYDDYNRIFNEVDVLLMPTTPTPPLKMGEKINDPIAMYYSDLFTISANLAAIPAISFPAGSSADGLPIGLQLQSKHYNEDILLQLSNALSK